MTYLLLIQIFMKMFLIPGLIIMTAHPMYEADGTLWNIGFAAGPDRNGIATSTWRYVIWKVTPPETKEEMKNPWLRLEIVAEVPSSKMWSIPYFHSFFMTENYVIIPEQPLLIGRPPQNSRKSFIQNPTVIVVKLNFFQIQNQECK